MLKFEIFEHLDLKESGDSPLSELGWAQARYLADEFAKEGPVNGVYASSFARCQESVQPLAERFNLQIQPVPGFVDTFNLRGHSGHATPHPHAGVWMAGSICANLERIRQEIPDGRVVICSIREVAPALLSYYAGLQGLKPFEPLKAHRGGIFTVVFGGEGIEISQREPSPDFPTSL